MDDIFTHVREGNALKVRVWLDDTENDLNQGDDHLFSLLHWAAREGWTAIVEMLLARGARVNATNMGDDTALHLAAGCGHLQIVRMLLHGKANINAVNEHGNTALHYACFWNHDHVAEELVNSGALVAMANRYGDTPLDRAKASLQRVLRERAEQLGQDLTLIPCKNRSWLGMKTRSRDATLSRHSGIDISQLALHGRISSSHSGDVWRGRWQENEIVAKILNIRDCTIRMSRDFKEEYPRLRIFNHANILPVLGVCNQPPSLVIISQLMPYGSLYYVLHGETGIVVDQNQALRFAVDIARGMEFLHTLDPPITQLHLNSKHVMIDEDLAKINVDDPRYQGDASRSNGVVTGIDEDLTARINMADYKFSFHERGKEYSPAWMAPEALQRRAENINIRAADMWSFALLLWELCTREVPFAELAPMEIGMRVAVEGLRVTVPKGIAPHMERLVHICMNEDPAKRPRFDAVIPILEKMKNNS